MAMVSVKVWCITMVVALASAIGTGIYWLVTFDDAAQARGARLIGIFMCCIIAFLIETPVRAMFFFHRVVKEKNKTSRGQRILTAVFGRRTVITPDVFYLLLWGLVLLFAVQRQSLGKSTSVLNVRSRCTIDPQADGCDDSSTSSSAASPPSSTTIDPRPYVFFPLASRTAAAPRLDVQQKYYLAPRRVV
eukprot:CAMPEP_0185718714 /NCGR_PEP_ID=MMETSP1164-20130828/47306_1 /TAXON_ID=1104430 /ORGANISM="Chrysoreinhardia sp, Strain CCMP2950" /LENGTH=189 /DNA_ID=CAMNT_0028386361 /DNA_START=20 /DNA_END=586 /DNA_ORIENTATION=-